MINQSQISAEILRLRRQVYVDTVAAFDALDVAEHPDPQPLPLHAAIAIGSGDWQRTLDAITTLARRASLDAVLASIRAAGLKLPAIAQEGGDG